MMVNLMGYALLLRISIKFIMAIDVVFNSVEVLLLGTL
jgi:hypothetical protein